MNMKKTALMLCAALSATFVLSACNTIQGAGKDVERAGEKVQDTAVRAKEKM